MNTETKMHGTAKQHRRLARLQHAALAMFETPHHGPVATPPVIHPPAMPKAVRTPKPAKEYKLVCLRECAITEPLRVLETPDQGLEYWKLCIETNPYFNPFVESFAVLMLNTRRRVTGFQIVSTGTLDTILVHPREVFRLAVHDGAAAIVLMHNHPSGDPTPSEADIKVTRDLIRAGQLLKIEVLDHIVIGQPTMARPKQYASLRELGYFYS